jgi:hypothetical protein
MKFDCIDTISEIIPYFGKLDEVFKICTSCTKTTWVIWHEYKDLLEHQGIARKTITFQDNMDFYSSLQFIYNDEFIMDLFEFEKITISQLNIYTGFSDFLDDKNVAKRLHINKLQLKLSKYDDFEMNLADSEIGQTYREEDEEIDKMYNMIIDKILKLKINVKQVISYLFLDQLQNRKLSYIQNLIIPVNDITKVEDLCGF